MGAVNQQQREQWNDENQATLWPKRERITTCVTRPLLDLLALQPGERVLEIGAGGGLAAIEAANAVAPSGEVVGFDLSAPLVNLATNRAAEADVPNVRFVVGDAQVDDIPGAPFTTDVAVPEDSMFDRETLDARIDEDRREQAWRDLQQLAASMRRSDGQLQLHLAVHFVRARNPH